MPDVAMPPLKQDQARTMILDLIRSGDLAPGSRLQPERELARMFAMNTRTVRQGLDKLVQEGVIERQARCGNYVRRVRCQEGIERIAVAFPEYLRRGKRYHPTIGTMLTAISPIFDQLETTVSIYWYAPGRFWLDAGHAIVESGVRGVLLFPHGSLVRTDLEQLQDAGIEMALLTQSSSPALQEVRIAGLELDMPEGLDRLMDRMVEMGHRRIAVGCYNPGPDYRRFTQVLLRHRKRTPDLPPMRDLLFDIDTSSRLELDILPMVLERRPRPTAIILPDEIVAREMFRLLYQQRLRVPEDISLAVILNHMPDGFPFALAGADGAQTTANMAEQAARLLKRLLDRETVDIATIRVPCEIEFGESIGAPAS